MAQIKIEHVALWTCNLEQAKSFYEIYFGAVSNQKYKNPKTQFESYFLTFSHGGARLELMFKLVLGDKNSMYESVGFAHVAFSVGSKEGVDALTTRLKDDGFVVVSGPRTTGDGYYESCVLDPDGNRIEITI